MKKRNNQSGQALIEMALMVPLLFWLVANVVNFGAFCYAWNTVSHATRSAAQFAATGPAYLGYGSANGLQTSPPSNTSAVAVVTSDMTSLPVTQALTNSCASTTSSVCVCTSTPAAACSVKYPDGTTPTFSDPETTSEVTVVNVVYRYCPLLTFGSFPALHISLTFFTACSGAGNSAGGVLIHRVAVLRSIQ